MGLFMYSGGESLCSNSKRNDDEAGWIRSGQILTMQVETDADTLKFLLDSKPHGPGLVTLATH